jgi:hypothetical protein
MKVKELIQALESYEPDAEVLMATQPSWPFENRVFGVVSREEMSPDAPPPHDGANTDVLLLEGTQLRYGSKAAWTR